MTSTVSASASTSAARIAIRSRSTATHSPSHAWRFSDALSAGKVLAPAKSVEEMQRVIVNDYVDATLAALFVAVVLAMAVYGVIAIRRALGTPRVTTVEVGSIGAVPEPGHA